jgi:hypothetical protein
VQQRPVLVEGGKHHRQSEEERGREKKKKKRIQTCHHAVCSKPAVLELAECFSEPHRALRSGRGGRK